MFAGCPMRPRRQTLVVDHLQDFKLLENTLVESNPLFPKDAGLEAVKQVEEMPVDWTAGSQFQKIMADEAEGMSVDWTAGSQLQQEDEEMPVEEEGEREEDQNVEESTPTAVQATLSKPVPPKYYEEVSFLDLNSIICFCPSSIKLPESKKQLLKELARRLTPVACKAALFGLNAVAPGISALSPGCNILGEILDSKWKRGNDFTLTARPTGTAKDPVETRPILRGITYTTVFANMVKDSAENDMIKRCRETHKDTITLLLNNEVVFTKKPVKGGDFVPVFRRFNITERAVFKLFNTFQGLNTLGGAGMRPMWDEDNNPPEIFNIEAMPPMKIDLSQMVIVASTGAAYMMTGSLEKVALPRY